jgi:hypothetical protein
MLSRFSKPPPLPEEFKYIESDTWMDIQEYDFRTINAYNWTSMVNDPAASNGRAVSMPGNHNEWATTIPIPVDEPLFENISDDTKFKVVAYVRCDATATDGLAMTLGIYDSKNRRNVAQKNPTVSDIAGSDYKKIEFEPTPLNQSMSVWFAPPKREGEVQAIYIDRLIIIRIEN